MPEQPVKSERHTQELLLNRLRRSMLFRPLALVLVVLLLPALPSAEQGGMNEAAAQTVNLISCEAISPTSILRKYCGAGNAPVPALVTLEADAVKTYLALHGIPQSEENVVYALGRRDLRNAVRSIMLTRLIDISLKQPQERTANERALYEWLQRLVQRNEVEYYSQTLAHLNSFLSDPCGFRLDENVEKAMKISYDNSALCLGSLGGLFANPPVPSSDYFRMYGLSKSYGKVSEDYPYAALLAADTQLNIPLIAGVSGTVGGIIVASAAAGLGSLLSWIVKGSYVAYLAKGLAKAGLTYSAYAVISTSSVSAVGGVVAAAAGPVAILLVAVTTGLVAGIQAFNNQQQLDNLANLRTKLALAQATLPDLAAMVQDSTDMGLYKLNLSFIGETLPDVESTSVLPQRRPNVDPIFRVADTRGLFMFMNEFTYRDWQGNSWSAYAWGNWLVQQCLTDAQGQSCAAVNSITGTIRYLDWQGKRWTASRLGNRFTHTKMDVATTDRLCPADLATGVTPATDFSQCSSYASDSVSLLNGRGLQTTVSVSPFQAPGFSGPTVLSFSPGLPATYRIQATGDPAPQICPTVNTLPAQIVVSPCTTSGFTISYDGAGSPAIGSFPLRLTATNTVGSRTQDYIVNVGTDVKIITPAILNTSFGQPVNFTIVAAGRPRPRFTLDPGVNLEGLSFRDNLDGTATISGTAGNATFFGPCEDLSSQSCPRIRASNGLTSDSQIFTVQVASPPLARHVGPFFYSVATGVESVINLPFGEAVTPVTWTREGNTPSWIRLTNGFDGVARLVVNPPAGTTGSFPVTLGVSALGTNQAINQTYTINVVNTPVFTSPNRISFTVGSPGAVLPTVANVTANTGVVSLNSILPPGITGQGNPATSSYSLTALPGNPPAGSGGQYQLQFESTSPTGTASQDVSLQIFERPSFTGAPLAVMFAGRPGAFTISTTGYPSTGALAEPLVTPPTNPADGLGMFFSTQGLPASLQASNRNLAGFPTGTLQISGTPLSAETGTHRVLVTAANGVGAPVQGTVTLQIYPYAPTRAVQLLTASAFTRDANNNYVATVVLANAGSERAQNVTISTARLNGVAGTIAPATGVSIEAAGTATFTIQFPASVTASAMNLLSIAGSHAGGSFSSTARVVLP